MRYVWHKTKKVQIMREDLLFFLSHYLIIFEYSLYILFISFYHFENIMIIGILL
ncbi:hypothetical protein GLOIN_2v1490017 [Rhizophagus irregularis DAOM 181602=DAOM 197198]|uniref:Uncharacterized protein n=1 Tax=Rhizophagus irregularis (strain DAOM 181602 / DAOM 197198 / MUCL 43194) TaxID=747089 RepID=A0A2P4R002_RHIID|nr:hypothetical protein GLOIN_2v1490017 [Rhizophagus irregularis DAOM 181602=DAOM 197198]POG83175.1 hypothetical protein GLOIN_2v1490017 [Rhizophagus irregularis DAOM 181602=DAOM 197198]|eukprot:XP_025190041.1 hypothetical protein GLOIN_2v1490017 [Rhizophagus irregularis DAOM 181602=DAOM 197198]